MEENNGVQPWQWAVTIAVVVILVGLGIYMMAKNDGTTTEMTDEDTQTLNATTSEGVNRLVATDQFPGNIVYLSTVQLGQSGFVTVHTDNNGQPGKIIGVKYFDKGSQPGSIDLTENTVEGGIYYAVLHMDDGDQLFDETKDTILNDAVGSPVVIKFNATVNLPEDKG